MTGQRFRFRCGECGQLHEGSPSFAFPAPYQYGELTADEKERIGYLSADFCEIVHPEQTDRFIRVILEIAIRGAERPFLWGVWVSLSEQNFEKYRENFTNDTYEDSYFGWLCNQLPYYPNTLYLKTRVRVTPGGRRPSLELEPAEHPLAIDYRNGISWEKAITIAQIAMHGEMD